MSHPDMVVFASFSDPSGTHGIRTMYTAFGLKAGDFPTIEAETTWEADEANEFARKNESHQYWLCLPIKEEA